MVNMGCSISFGHRYTTMEYFAMNLNIPKVIDVKQHHGNFQQSLTMELL